MKTQTTKIVVLALTLALGISYVSAASTWQAPSVAAPGGNTDVPINVGSNAQSKQGDFAVGAFLANLNSQILGNLTIGATSSSASLIIPKGASAGKVLTALDSTGAAVWATSTGGGGTGSSSTVVLSGKQNGASATFVLPTGTWLVNFTATYANCILAPVNLLLDGVVIGTDPVNFGDQQGCDSGTIVASVPVVTAGTHTLTMQDTNTSDTWFSGATHVAEKQYAWTAFSKDASFVGYSDSGLVATSSMKTWTDSAALAPNRTFTVTHGFTNKPLVKASLVKVAANNTNVDSDRDTFPVGTEIGIESFWQWPNSYDSPFSVTVNDTSITVHVNATVQYFYGERDYFSIPTAKMNKWRLKITAVGDTNMTPVADPTTGSIGGGCHPAPPSGTPVVSWGNASVVVTGGLSSCSCASGYTSHQTAGGGNPSAICVKN